MTQDGARFLDVEPFFDLVRQIFLKMTLVVHPSSFHNTIQSLKTFHLILLGLGTVKLFSLVICYLSGFLHHIQESFKSFFRILIITIRVFCVKVGGGDRVGEACCCTLAFENYIDYYEL